MTENRIGFSPIFRSLISSSHIECGRSLLFLVRNFSLHHAGFMMRIGIFESSLVQECDLLNQTARFWALLYCIVFIGELPIWLYQYVVRFISAEVHESLHELQRRTFFWCGENDGSSGFRECARHACERYCATLFLHYKPCMTQQMRVMANIYYIYFVSK